MPVPTAATSNALSRDSRIVFSNHSSAYLRVASSTATSITVDNSDLITGKTLYAVANPGQVEIITGVAAGDNGKTTKATGFSGNVITVTDDLTAALADGSIIVVNPPQALELSTNGGHTLQYSSPNEGTKGLGDAALTHNTPHIADITGDIPFYFPTSTQGVARLIAWAIGAYKKSGTGQHDIVPLVDNDGTYTDLSRASVYDKVGSGVIEQVFGNLFCTALTINIPESAPITGSASAVGNVYNREVGGTGKTFSTGANSYVVSGLPCDDGSRYTSVSAFVQFGGSFGGALGDTRETTVTSVTLNYTKESDAPRAIGNQYPLNPEEAGFDLTVTLPRSVVNNTLHDYHLGGKADAANIKTETRLLIALVPTNPASTDSILIDIPRGVIDDDPITRQRGRFAETVTFRALHTLTAAGCIDTAVPAVRVRVLNGKDFDIGTSLS